MENVLEDDFQVTRKMTDFEIALLRTRDQPDRTQTVETVRQTLAGYRHKYRQARDPRTIFTHAYELVTEAVRDKVAAQGFPHRVWLAVLDDKFAQLYCAALDAYDQALALERQARASGPGYDRQVAAAWKKVPRVWKVAFDAIGAGRPVPTWRPQATVLQALLLPLIAHTLHDLPLAVAEMALDEARFLTEIKRDVSPGQALASARGPHFDCEHVEALHKRGFVIRDFLEYINDYNEINFLLLDRNFQVIHAVQQAMGGYNPVLWRLDRWLRGVDELMTFRFLQLMRGMAWHDATRLVEADSAPVCRGVRQAIEQRTIFYLHYFSRPQSWWGRLALWLIRLISGVTWRWPGEEVTSAQTGSVASRGDLQLDKI